MYTSKIFAILMTLVISGCKTQVNNAKKDTFGVSGNCNECKAKIETASTEKNISVGVWDENKKEVTLTYDSTKTNANALLKKIAYAGYDNEKYSAPDNAFKSLAPCCQYERKGAMNNKASMSDANKRMPENDPPTIAAGEIVVPVNPLAVVYANYFELKDALIKDDGKAANNQAKELFEAIADVNMETLLPAQHTVWMEYQKLLSKDAELIKGTTDIDKQREHFASLSNNMYSVMKVIKSDYTVYYDHCPMYDDGKGANWLSKENGIKNPYYGAQMLGCGKTTETIK